MVQSWFEVKVTYERPGEKGLNTKVNEVYLVQGFTFTEIEKQYGSTFTFGKEYILPKPGDKRLLTEVSAAVAHAAMESGVARRGIASFNEYRQALLARVESENFFAREYVRHTVGNRKIERER